MASAIYNKYKVALFDSSTKVDLEGGDVKLALTTASYTPNLDTHDFFNDVTNELPASGGYTAGGQGLANVSLSLDTTNDRVTFDADDVTWSSSTLVNARYGILYNDTGTPATSRLIALIDFGSNRSSSLTNFVVQWNAAGIIRLT